MKMFYSSYIVFALVSFRKEMTPLKMKTSKNNSSRFFNLHLIWALKNKKSGNARAQFWSILLLTSWYDTS